MKTEAFRPEKENEDLSDHGLRLAQKKAGPRETAEGLREGERCPGVLRGRFGSRF